MARRVVVDVDAVAVGAVVVAVRVRAELARRPTAMSKAVLTANASTRNRRRRDRVVSAEANNWPTGMTILMTLMRMMITLMGRASRQRRARSVGRMSLARVGSRVRARRGNPRGFLESLGDHKNHTDRRSHGARKGRMSHTNREARKSRADPRSLADRRSHGAQKDRVSRTNHAAGTSRASHSSARSSMSRRSRVSLLRRASGRRSSRRPHPRRSPRPLGRLNRTWCGRQRRHPTMVDGTSR